MAAANITPQDLTQEELAAEEWRPCPGYPDRYLVSSMGRVRGVLSGVILAPGVMPRGYLYVSLCRKTHLVHRLVALAFVFPQDPAAPQVNHLDLVKANNRASNLEWVSNTGNRVHAIASGAIPSGEDRHGHKLCGADVVAIREACRSGISQSVTARRFGVSQSAVSLIYRGKKWRHVT